LTMSSPRPVRHALVCVECGTLSASPAERGWRGYLSDDRETDEHELVWYCPICAVAEFGPAPSERDA
jgi:hypothetical protein